MTGRDNRGEEGSGGEMRELWMNEFSLWSLFRKALRSCSVR